MEIIEKEEIKSRIFEYFGSNKKATRKQLTAYMKDLWSGSKEQGITNNKIGKIMNEETKVGRFNKEKGENRQLIFTLKKGGLEIEEVKEVEEEVYINEETEDEEEEEEDEEEELSEAEEMQKAVDEVKAEEEDYEEEEEDDEEEEVELSEEELVMVAYEKATGKSAMTTAGTKRKSFLKWKKNN